jgi:hypothetical protein
MTFGVDTFGRLGHAAETLVLDATEYDVAGTGGPIYVKWYASSQSYWWDGSKVGLGRGYRDSGYASASGIANWLSNTLSYTKGKNIEFLTLGPSDTDQPIDCEMFAWGSWSDWSDCADGQQIRTRTRAVKTPHRFLPFRSTDAIRVPGPRAHAGRPAVRPPSRVRSRALGR